VESTLPFYAKPVTIACKRHQAAQAMKLKSKNDRNITSKNTIPEEKGFMKNLSRTKARPAARLQPVLKPIALFAALYCASAAHAFQFKTESGITGSFDTTVSLGVSVRAKDADPSLIGIANGGTSRSVNEDDGDRAYQKNKAFAEVLKATHDLEVKYENYGAFVRGSYFYDFVNHDRENLGDIGKKRIGQDARILDAYVYGSFQPGGKNLRMRLGQQVVSWGESTFIPGGINVINPVDVSKLRIPGSELKEAFIPSKMLWASQELTSNASVEGFVLTNWDKTKLDPRGSYFSNNDYASDDGYNVFTGFGRRNDLGRLPGSPQPAGNPLSPATPGIGAVAPGIICAPLAATCPAGVFTPAAAVYATRTDDHNASDHGQYGLAFRYLATDLNNTEFAFYHITYHSRIPLFSGIKGTVTTALTGTSLATPTGQTGTATYFAEYPENIRLFGVSFNTAGPMGVALQGEYSYRPNLPLQYATPELVLASLGAPNVVTGFEQVLPPSASLPFGASRAGLVLNGTLIQGWQRVKASTAQVTGTKAFPNLASADQLALVGEIGLNEYHNLPSDKKFNGPGVYLPARPEGAVAGQAGSIQETGFATNFSWGYRLVGRLDYTNSLFGSNMSPRLAFSHDVKGVSQTFNEGTKSLSAGVNFEYRKSFTVDLSYTTYSGGRTYCGTDQVTNPGQTSLVAQINGVAQLGIAPQGADFCSSANPLRDRDFYSVVLTYSF
jgi:hypothetical protein